MSAPHPAPLRQPRLPLRTHVVAFRRDEQGRLQRCEGEGATLLEARAKLEDALRDDVWVGVRP